MEPKLTVEAGVLRLTGPYHPDLAREAKAMGGKWDPEHKSWNFDPREEEWVRGIAVRVWGTDGTAAELVTIHVNLDSHPDKPPKTPKEIYLAGRLVARRVGRDEEVRLGDGVVILEGGFARSGGSVANPRLEWKPGTVLRLRDVPAGHRDLSRSSRYVEIVDQTVNVEALRSERERLVARLAEIDALIGEES